MTLEEVWTCCFVFLTCLYVCYISWEYYLIHYVLFCLLGDVVVVVFLKISFCAFISRLSLTIMTKTKKLCDCLDEIVKKVNTPISYIVVTMYFIAMF